MAEITRRAVRCKIHGLRYDPALTSGCIRCRKQGLSASKPVFLSLLLVLLAFAAVAAVVIQGWIDFRSGSAGAEAAAASDVPAAASSRQKVDPTPYRPRLTALEDALYDDAATDLVVIGDRVAGAAAALTAALAAAPEHRWAAEAMAGFEREARDTEPTLERLARQRDVWLDLRQRLFAPAPWLISPPAVTGERLAVASTRDAIAGLIALLEEAADVEPDAWPTYEQEWSPRLQAALGRLPPPPSYEADSRLLIGRRELDRALGEVSAITFDGSPDALRSRLDAIAERLASARDLYEEALDG